MPRSQNYLIVAAFDFGTTYSGYAYSYRSDPSRVLVNQNWYSGDASSRLVSLKNPTSVLLDGNGKFCYFGFEAEDKFALLAEDKKHRGWRLFRCFKMMLHENKNLSRDSTVDDIEGKPYPAMDIFAMAIEYLKEHLLKSVQAQTTSILETDINYVITVPAIWDIIAKQFMREAAIKAGIDGDRLMLAFESEVAALWCTRYEITDHQVSDLRSTGAKYMVIDLGGGTADITVHEKNSDDSVKVIHKASGGAWGGTVMDQQFLGYLEKLYGKSVFNEFRGQNINDFFELIRNFETKKRSNALCHDFFLVRVPFSLREIHSARNSSRSNFKNFLKLFRRSSSGEHSILNAQTLRLDSSDVIAWFEKPVSLLVQHVKKLLGDYKIRDVRTILLVGGFAESGYVQDRLRKEFSGVTLIVPKEAGLAVMKGAVLFGHNPDLVTSRVMAHTYGIKVYRRFDETKYPQDKKVLVNGEWTLGNVFKVFVRVNDEISTNDEVSYNVLPTRISSVISIYRTISDIPKYTTDPGCELLGELKISNIEHVPLNEQLNIVTFMFGHTELLVKVKHMHTGEEQMQILDCLQ